MSKEKTTTHTSALVQEFSAARRASVPLLAIETTDPAQVIRAIATTVNGDAPVITWDPVRGLAAAPGNSKAESAIAKALGQASVPQIAMTVNLVVALKVAGLFPEYSVLIIMNAHRVVVDLQPMQAVWLLRDVYKLNNRTAVLLAPHWSMPAELKHDVVLYREPLPTREQL